MRTINRSLYWDQDGNPRPEAVRGSLGIDWMIALRGEEQVAGRLAETLTDQHVLVRNATLPQFAADADMILVGPTGVWALEVRNVSGTCRIEGDKWILVGESNKPFAPTDNPIRHVQNVAHGVLEYLHASSLPLPHIGVAVVLANPETRLQLEDPAISVVPEPEIERFAFQEIRAQDVIMDDQDVEAVVEALLRLAVDPSRQARPLVREGRERGMTRTQWGVLALMAMANFLLWAIFLYVAYQVQTGARLLFQ